MYSARASLTGKVSAYVANLMLETVQLAQIHFQLLGESLNCCNATILWVEPYLLVCALPYYWTSTARNL